MNTARPARTLKAVAIAGLLALDLILAHHFSSQKAVQGWGVILAALPMTVIGLLAVQRFFGTIATLLAACLVGVSGFLLFGTLKQHVDWIYLLQHLTVNLLLGLWFGRSLLKQRQPLCTTFACMLHENMHEQLIRYTRRLTLAWTLFFFAMAGTSILLFLFAPITVWSTFANLLTLPLVVLMFLIEYRIRIRVLPPEDHLGITSAFRAYRRVLAGDTEADGPPVQTSSEHRP